MFKIKKHVTFVEEKTNIRTNLLKCRILNDMQIVNFIRGIIEALAIALDDMEKSTHLITPAKGTEVCVLQLNPMLALF